MNVKQIEMADETTTTGGAAAGVVGRRRRGRGGDVAPVVDVRSLSWRRARRRRPPRRATVSSHPAGHVAATTAAATTAAAAAAARRGYRRGAARAAAASAAPPVPSAAAPSTSASASWRVKSTSPVVESMRTPHRTPARNGEEFLARTAAASRRAVGAAPRRPRAPHRAEGAVLSLFHFLQASPRRSPSTSTSAATTRRPRVLRRLEQGGTKEDAEERRPPRWSGVYQVTLKSSDARPLDARASLRRAPPPLFFLLSRHLRRRLAARERRRRVGAGGGAGGGDRQRRRVRQRGRVRPSRPGRRRPAPETAAHGAAARRLVEARRRPPHSLFPSRVGLGVEERRRQRRHALFKRGASAGGGRAVPFAHVDGRVVREQRRDAPARFLVVAVAAVGDQVEGAEVGRVELGGRAVAVAADPRARRCSPAICRSGGAPAAGGWRAAARSMLRPRRGRRGPLQAVRSARFVALARGAEDGGEEGGVVGGGRGVDGGADRRLPVAVDFGQVLARRDQGGSGGVAAAAAACSALLGAPSRARTSSSLQISNGRRPFLREDSGRRRARAGGGRPLRAFCWRSAAQ